MKKTADNTLEIEDADLNKCFNEAKAGIKSITSRFFAKFPIIKKDDTSYETIIIKNPTDGQEATQVELNGKCGLNIPVKLNDPKEREILYDKLQKIKIQKNAIELQKILDDIYTTIKDCYHTDTEVITNNFQEILIDDKLVAYQKKDAEAIEVIFSGKIKYNIYKTETDVQNAQDKCMFIAIKDQTGQYKYNMCQIITFQELYTTNTPIPIFSLTESDEFTLTGEDSLFSQ